MFGTIGDARPFLRVEAHLLVNNFVGQFLHGIGLERVLTGKQHAEKDPDGPAVRREAVLQLASLRELLWRRHHVVFDVFELFKHVLEQKRRCLGVAEDLEMERVSLEYFGLLFDDNAVRAKIAVRKAHVDGESKRPEQLTNHLCDEVFRQRLDGPHVRQYVQAVSAFADDDKFVAEGRIEAAAAEQCLRFDCAEVIVQKPCDVWMD